MFRSVGKLGAEAKAASLGGANMILEGWRALARLSDLPYLSSHLTRAIVNFGDIDGIRHVDIYIVSFVSIQSYRYR